jgi:endonuclease/exonuclease/phosphatase family metal-dependent hydrolase
MHMSRRRLALLLVTLLLLGALGPYGLSRATAARDRVRVTRLGEPAGPKDPAHLRVAAYNIAHLRGLPEDNWAPSAEERDQRAHDIAALLQDIDADVVVLNEVDFDASWSGRVNAARLLAERAGYPVVVEERNLDFCVGFLCWRFGNAILSRVPVRDVRVLDLPALAGWEEHLVGKKRGVLATLALEGGDVRLAAVHLSHRDEGVRAGSATLLDQLADEGPPLIVTGDLNAAPSTFPKAERTRDGFSAFRIFDGNGHFLRRPAGARPSAGDLTYPSSSPDRVLDWILIPPGLDFARYEVVRTGLSDHLPVVADLRPSGLSPGGSRPSGAEGTPPSSPSSADAGPGADR